MPENPPLDAATSPDNSRWYYAQDGVAIGPMTLAAIQTLWRAGELTADTFVVREGTEEWKPLSEVSVDATKPPSLPPIPPQATPSQPSRQKTNTEDAKWYERAGVVLASLVLCFPLGLAFLWKSRHFSTRARIGWTAVVSIIFIYGMISNRTPINRRSVDSTSQKTEQTDVSKLRVAKPKSRLFADEKAMRDFDQYNAEQRATMIERMEYERSSFFGATYRKVEVLQDNGLRNMTLVRIYSKMAERSFDMWIEPSNLLAFDSELVAKGDLDYEEKFKEVRLRIKERSLRKGNTVTFNENTLLLAEDDALWEWIEVLDKRTDADNEKTQALVHSKIVSLVSTKRAVATVGKSAGIIVNPEGPRGRWLQIESNMNGKPVHFWMNYADVATEEQKHGSPISQKDTTQEVEAPSKPTIAWSEVNRIYNLKSKYSDLQKDEEWKKFKGKQIVWNGVVSEISDGAFMGLQLQVKMNRETFISDVIVQLNKSERAKALMLKKGSPVTYSGTLGSWGTLMPITVSDGSIVSP